MRSLARIFARRDLPRFEHLPEAVGDLPDPPSRKSPDLLHKKGLVYGHDLGDVDYARPGQVRFALFEENVPGGLGPSRVRGDGAENGRSDAAAIKCVVLDDHM
ncbi:MAG: hypothetical protein MZV63_14255 [Marinilabiliales bacterium]|nr:hypothetical protein [Marinilabiliales bacterium]